MHDGTATADASVMVAAGDAVCVSVATGGWHCIAVGVAVGAAAHLRDKGGLPLRHALKLSKDIMCHQQCLEITMRERLH
jgi:hypothetical protein